MSLAFSLLDIIKLIAKYLKFPVNWHSHEVAHHPKWPNISNSLGKFKKCKRWNSVYDDLTRCLSQTCTSSWERPANLLRHIIVTFNWPLGDKTSKNGSDKSQTFKKEVAVKRLHRELISLFYVTQVMENTVWLQVGFDCRGVWDVFLLIFKAAKSY